jgi:D-xylose transport system permease protein
VSTASPQEVQVAAQPRAGLREAWREYVDKLKAGDMGSLPVIVGMIIIVILFRLKVDVFLTAVNFDNLITQLAGTVLLAIGVVFVLLLGEIDLSIGFLSGVCAVAAAYFQQPGTNHDFNGLVAIALALALGAALGAIQGSFVAFIGVPSFVVTLSGLLVFQGVVIKWLGSQAAIGIEDHYVNDTANYFLPTTAGWIVAGVITAAYTLASIGGIVSRRRAGLPPGNVAVIVVRIVLVAASAFVVTAIANHARGVPFAGLLVVAMLALWTFIARRTTFGRHVYAVGGNAEAARRSGINVKFIRVAVFMISGTMAALGGIVFAARISSVAPDAGSGSRLLDAIAAAVIGGTSLFGGRGRVVAALLGGLVIATIANGLSLIGSSASTQYIVTGVILLAAVTLDTVSRRRLVASGR